MNRNTTHDIPNDTTRQAKYVEVNLKKLAIELESIRQRSAPFITDDDWTTLHNAQQVIQNLARLE